MTSSLGPPLFSFVALLRLCGEPAPFTLLERVLRRGRATPLPFRSLMDGGERTEVLMAPAQKPVVPIRPIPSSRSRCHSGSVRPVTPSPAFCENVENQQTNDEWRNIETKRGHYQDHDQIRKSICDELCKRRPTCVPLRRRAAFFESAP